MRRTVLGAPKAVKFALVHGWRRCSRTRRQAEAAIFYYINGCHNTHRRHSYFGGISPLAFDTEAA
jgi:putative transposase